MIGQLEKHIYYTYVDTKLRDNIMKYVEGFHD